MVLALDCSHQHITRAIVPGLKIHDKEGVQMPEDHVPQAASQHLGVARATIDRTKGGVWWGGDRKMLEYCH